MLNARFNVKLMLVRTFQSSTYLNVGPGAVVAFVYLVVRLAWFPTTPSGAAAR